MAAADKRQHEWQTANVTFSHKLSSVTVFVLALVFLKTAAQCVSRNVQHVCDSLLWTLYTAPDPIHVHYLQQIVPLCQCLSSCFSSSYRHFPFVSVRVNISHTHSLTHTLLGCICLLDSSLYGLWPSVLMFALDTSCSPDRPHYVTACMSAESPPPFPLDSFPSHRQTPTSAVSSRLLNVWSAKILLKMAQKMCSLCLSGSLVERVRQDDSPQQMGPELCP